MKTMVYYFGGGKADGKAEMKEILGGKGANLAEMIHLGLPVPAGFTISTEVCNEFYRMKKKYPKGLKDQADKAVRKVEAEMGTKFGDVTARTDRLDVAVVDRAAADARQDAYNLN